MIFKKITKGRKMADFYKVHFWTFRNFLKKNKLFHIIHKKNFRKNENWKFWNDFYKSYRFMANFRGKFHTSIPFEYGKRGRFEQSMRGSDRGDMRGTGRGRGRGDFDRSSRETDRSSRDFENSEPRTSSSVGSKNVPRFGKNDPLGKRQQYDQLIADVNKHR